MRMMHARTTNKGVLCARRDMHAKKKQMMFFCKPVPTLVNERIKTTGCRIVALTRNNERAYVEICILADFEEMILTFINRMQPSPRLREERKRYNDSSSLWF
jgi:hypothetical protein